MNNEDIKLKLQTIRNGDMGLLETFWVYFLAVFVVLSFGAALLGPFGEMLSLAAIGWTVFMLFPVFKAADKYQGAFVWAILAKVGMVVFSGAVCIGALIKVFSVFGG